MKRTAGLAMMAAMSAGLLTIGSCSEDTAPGADHQIRVERARFFPNVVEVRAGATVRWVNILARDPDNLRTVTSGLVDSTATHGLLFDVTLEGHEPGEAFGESYTYRFTERGTVDYFSRFPSGDPFTGTIVVR